MRNQLTNQKSELDAKLSEITADNLEVKLPPAVKEQNKLNLILVGPNNVGRTTIGNYMAAEHQRFIIKLDMLVDYWQKRNHPIAEEVAKYQEEKAAELEQAIKDLEALKKAKKLKKGEPEPVINEAEYKLLPKELLTKMV